MSMQVLILRFGAIEILINTDFRDLRIRYMYQNFDKSLPISVCRVVIIILIRVKRSLSVRNSLSFSSVPISKLFFIVQ